jgi:hypothetical protein
MQSIEFIITMCKSCNINEAIENDDDYTHEDYCARCHIIDVRESIESDKGSQMANDYDDDCEANEWLKEDLTIFANLKNILYNTYDENYDERYYVNMRKRKECFDKHSMFLMEKVMIKNFELFMFLSKYSHTTFTNLDDEELELRVGLEKMEKMENDFNDFDFKYRIMDLAKAYGLNGY